MHSLDQAFQDRYDDAAWAYCTGSFEAAAAGFYELARLGCAPAAAYLAMMHLRGEGVERDVEKGLGLLRLATAWGCAHAAYSLGALHRSGAESVPRDVSASRRYSQLARELGCELPIDDFLA